MLDNFKVDGKYIDLASYFICVVYKRIVYILLPIILNLLLCIGLQHNNLRDAFMYITVVFIILNILIFIICYKFRRRKGDLKLEKVRSLEKIKMASMFLIISFIEMVVINITQ